MHTFENKYFGVNIRFIDANNNPCTHTIVIKNTKLQHATKYLHKLVKDILEECEIEKDHVL